jgi:hypothetical protein
MIHNSECFVICRYLMFKHIRLDTGNLSMFSVDMRKMFRSTLLNDFNVRLQEIARAKRKLEELNAQARQLPVEKLELELRRIASYLDIMGASFVDLNSSAQGSLVSEVRRNLTR